MKVATLVLVVRERNGARELLLARKKVGEIGVGKISPPGGKLEPGESLIDCCQRECLEELRTLPENLMELAVLDVYRIVADGYAEGSIPEADIEEALGEREEHFMRVFVYLCTAHAGRPQETSEMEEPFWARADSIPYEEMYGGDDHWMPHLLGEEPLHRHFSLIRRNGVCEMHWSQDLKPFDELMAQAP